MTKLIIAYSPNPREVGTTKDVDEPEASTMVRQGRARYAEESKTAPPARPPQPGPSPEG